MPDAVLATAYIDEALRDKTYRESMSLSKADRMKAIAQAWKEFKEADAALNDCPDEHVADLRLASITQHSVWDGHVKANDQREVFERMDRDAQMRAEQNADDIKARVMAGDGAPNRVIDPTKARLVSPSLGLFRAVLGDESLSMQGWIDKYRNMGSLPGIHGEDGLNVKNSMENARLLAHFLTPHQVYDPLLIGSGVQMVAVETGNVDGTIPAGPFALDPNVPSSMALSAFATTPTSTYTIKYRRKGSFPSSIVRNVTELQVAPDWTPTTTNAEDKLNRVSLSYAISRPTEMDDQGLAAEFDMDMVDAVRGKLSQQVLYGDGTRPNLNGLAQLGTNAVEFQPYTVTGNTALNYAFFGESLDEAFAKYGGGTGGIVSAEPNPNILILNREDWYGFTAALLTKSGALQVPVSSLTGPVAQTWRGARLIIDEQVTQFAPNPHASNKLYFGFLFNNNPRITQLFVAGNFGIRVVEVGDDAKRDTMTHIIHFYACLVTRSPKGVVLLYQGTGSTGRVRV